MGFIDSVVVNIIHTILPVLVYLFYIAYKNIDDEREHNLALTIMLFTQFYIVYKYNGSLIDSIPSLAINAPLIIAYIKKKDFTAIFLSLVIVAYLYNFYNDYLLLLVFEYLLFYLVYKKYLKKEYFIVVFSFIKTFSILVIIYLIGYTMIQKYIEGLLVGLIFCILMLFMIYIMDKALQVFRLHKTFKETLEIEEVKTSLFRITHEIKNPIAVCKGYLDMFDVNNLNHAHKYVPIIKEEVDKTLLLLDDFLSMNRLKLNKDILDINLLIDEVLDNYSFYLKEHKIKLINNILEDEVYIDGDYNRLVQVFVNLIKNSVEAIDGEGIIEVISKVKRGNIYISITDNGSGISKDCLQKIKRPFFTTKKDGNGLGVSLSNEIVEAHGGTMEYKSKEGEYTKVIIMLPIIKI